MKEYSCRAAARLDHRCPEVERGERRREEEKQEERSGREGWKGGHLFAGILRR